MKKLLLSLFVGLFTLIGFSSASFGNIVQFPAGSYYYAKSQSMAGIVPESSFLNTSTAIPSGVYLCLSNIVYSTQTFSQFGVFKCSQTTNGTSINFFTNLPDYCTLVDSGFTRGNSSYSVYSGNINCYKKEAGYQYYLGKDNTSNGTVYFNIAYLDLDKIYSGYIISSQCPSCPSCPIMSSLECQTNYSLIPVSSIDQSYCVSNDLCPDYIGTGEDLERSNIYINDIFHPGKPFINVNIPDYISWSYTSTGDYFNLDVGSGYDLDYINSVVSINSYRPTSEDFTNVFVSGLTLVMPYIVILLFIVFIWKFIKRIFK